MPEFTYDRDKDTISRVPDEYDSPSRDRREIPLDFRTLITWGSLRDRPSETVNPDIPPGSITIKSNLDQARERVSYDVPRSESLSLQDKPIEPVGPDIPPESIIIKSNLVYIPSTINSSTATELKLHHPSSALFSHAISCLFLFQKLHNSGILIDFKLKVPLSRWKDELGRFRIWCSNTGVYQKGDSSLDYRLRDSPHLSGQVMRQLEWLRSALQDLQAIPDMLQADDSDPEPEDTSPEDEVQEMYLDVRDTINGLFEIAIMIQKPIPHNFYSIDERKISSWQNEDRALVRKHFPKAKAEITERLSSALSRRRAFLTSHEENFKERAACPAVSVEYSTACSAVVAEFEKACSDIMEVGLDTDEVKVQFIHETKAEGFTLVYPPGGAFDGTTFECPLCFFLIDATDKKSWMHHLALDLMPYICIFKDCNAADRIYGEKDEWLRHLHEIHGFGPKNQCCPLCLKVVGRDYDVRSHLAEHLENLAVMSIPPDKLSGNTDLLWTRQCVKPTQTVKFDSVERSRVHKNHHNIPRLALSWFS